MTPEEKDLLQKTYDLTKENNHLMKKLRNSNRWSSFFRVIYWIIIIGVSVGTFHYIQPYLDPIFKTFSGIQGDLSGVKSFANEISGSGTSTAN